MEENHKDSWKNKSVFLKQLELNRHQLSNPNNYPEHWHSFKHFLNELETSNPKTILDIGCGCGAMSQLCLPEIKYTGIDYAQEAIDVAKINFNAEFFCMDYQELTKEFTDKYDILLCSSLHNILQNGDDCVDFILNLIPKTIILCKMMLTHRSSYYSVYVAYDSIVTYLYRHNESQLLDKFNAHGYDIQRYTHEDTSDFLLRSKNV